MEQQKALNALAPYLALTHSASSPRAAADLIERATSAANTFIFAELLEAPQIRALAKSESHSSYLKLLEIFSYGTYNTYRATPSLPALNAAQILKLRQLSFLTLAKYQDNLSYANLMRDLGLETQREVEDLVISVIYAGLVDGALDPYHQRAIVTSISPLRDLEPNSIPVMLKTLDKWSTSCFATLTELEKQISRIKADAWKRYKDETAWTENLNSLVDSIPGKDKEGQSLRGNFDVHSPRTQYNPKGFQGVSEARDIDEAENIVSRTPRLGRKRGLGT
ncbi:hypothetical protein K3495_g7928 [Podosphaera aphanis]|nr:hypothetical protein K3495_g7928 [Podosphaera aphanis]